MSKKKFKHMKTREGFITRANERHNNKYDYSKVQFPNRQPQVKWNGELGRKPTEYYRDTKITITCPIHGDFVQTARKHIESKPSGCQRCSTEAGGRKLSEGWKAGRFRAHQRKHEPIPKKDNQVCSKCKQELPLTNEFFSIDKQKQTGFRPSCKTCVNKYQRSEHARALGRERDRKQAAKLPTGIYRIRNIINDCAYIGKSIRLPERLRHHKGRLRAGNHKNSRLQNDWVELGEESFAFEIIEKLPCNTSNDVLKEKEWDQAVKYLREGKDVYNSLN